MEANHRGSPVPDGCDSPDRGVMDARLLIVDDHASFRAFARRLLSVDGFDVIGEATDGAAALSATRELCPDVVLLHVQLPHVDGFSVAEALAARPSAPAVVLVVRPRPGRLRRSGVPQQCTRVLRPGGPERGHPPPGVARRGTKRAVRPTRNPAFAAGSTADLAEQVGPELGPAGGAGVRGATRPSSPACVVAGPDLKETET